MKVSNPIERKFKLVADANNGILSYEDDFLKDEEEIGHSISDEIEKEDFLMARSMDEFIGLVDRLNQGEIICFYATSTEKEEIEKITGYGIH